MFKRHWPIFGTLALCSGALPGGFRLASSSLKFVPQEAQEMGELPMKLTVICLEDPTDQVAKIGQVDVAVGNGETCETRFLGRFNQGLKLW